MKALSVFGSLLAAAPLLAGLVSAAAYDDIDPIVIKGSKFFYKNSGKQFFMNGIAYQQEVGPGGSSSSESDSKKRYRDPLTDPAGCRRDVPLLKELNMNIVRVYAVDPSGNHDECMELLAEAGIYVIADLSQPDQSVKSEDPAWTVDLYNRYTSVIDALQGYNNVMGFFAGNEVSHRANNTAASAFVKASVRDSKAYIKKKGYHQIGVGYATNDDEEIRDQLLAYFNCGDAADSVDFWGYNIYSWCGKSNMEDSGYNKHVQEYKDFNVPVFFAEYGCNKVTPRIFDELLALLGPEMTPVFSGGIMYMYFQEANDYGVVQVKDGKAVKLQDFTNLSKAAAKATPSGVKMSDYTPTNTAALACPTVDEIWQAKSSPLPPPVNVQLCECMQKQVPCSVSKDADEEDFGELFGQVCGYGDDICLGIVHNATTGEYGAYSVCNPREQLSWAMSRYYASQNNRADACDFDGNAEVRTVSSPSGSCSSLLKNAGDNGESTYVPSSEQGSDGSGSLSAWPSRELGLAALAAGAGAVAMVLL